MGPFMSAVAGPVAGALVGAAGSIFSSKQSADFAERSYKHRYQWQVKDLQKAGLNPMLAVSQGAPNVAQPTFQNVGEGAIKGFSAAAAARVASAQVKNIEADTMLKGSAQALNIASTRESAIRAGIAEESLPFAAKQAETTMLTQDRTFQIMGRQLEKLGYEVGSARLTLEQQEKMNPLLVRAQMLINQGMSLDMVKRDAKAALWEIAPDHETVNKVLDLLKEPGSLPRRIHNWGKKYGYSGR